MNKDYKRVILIILAGFFLVFLAGFQIAFINNFTWKFNIFLVLILFLILAKNIYSAIFLAWLAGFLIDTVHFSTFGVTSLTLLLLTGFLIIFQKKALITTKIEGILTVSVIAVLLYRFLEWALNNIFNSGLEKLSFYFLNGEILAELLLTPVLLLMLFKSKFRSNVQKYIF